MPLNESSSRSRKVITVALAGQPNTGKSTLFNSLTGSNQHVGNWPGKTVEKMEGRFARNGSTCRIVDLPGTYSLSAGSKEEIIARDFIIKEAPDLVVVVVDASQLTRSLYLVAEMLPLGVPLVVALNMMDVARVRGLTIDVDRLASHLGLRVVPMTASKNIGIGDLAEAIDTEACARPSYHRIHFDPENAFTSLLGQIENCIRGYVPTAHQTAWVAQKLLEGDGGIIDLMQQRMHEEQWQSLRAMLPADHQGALAVANARYDWIKKILASCLVRNNSDGTPIRRNMFDTVATHPLAGAILGIAVTLTGFILSAMTAFGSVAVVHPLAVTGIQSIQHMAGDGLPVLTDFICQGLIPGLRMVWGVSVFIFAIMLFIGLIEDIGYLPRMAYVADLFMSRIGLPGKSIMPLFMGLGCNIAAVMGCRVVETTRQRFKTIVISSHVPCPGVMLTIAFIIGVFFGPIAPLIVIAAVAALLLQTVITSKLLDHSVLKGIGDGMLMELPPYHMPNWRTIWNYVWRHLKAFLQKAGSLIMAIVVVVWALSYFPGGNMVDSYLASAVRCFEPVGMLMGMDWKLLTCLFVAFFSKEAALIAMAVLYGLQTADGSLPHMMMGQLFPQAGNAAVGRVLAESVSRPSALAFIFAILFSVPCYATVGAIYYETKSLKWTLGSVIYYTTLSLVWGIAAYQAGLLIFTPR